MKIYWEAILNNGIINSGLVNDGSWRQLKTFVQKNGIKIQQFRLHSIIAESNVDQDADGYFLGNKVIASIESDKQFEMVGIGYWKKDDPMVRIIWHDSNTMDVVETEGRSVEDCGFLLLKN
jgi:hypothetical protein